MISHIYQRISGSLATEKKQKKCNKFLKIKHMIDIKIDVKNAQREVEEIKIKLIPSYVYRSLA